MRDLSGIKLAVLGGDRREVEAARLFILGGAETRVIGLPQEPGLEKATQAETLEEAVTGVEVVVGPVLGLDDEGYLHVLPGQPRLCLTQEVINRIPRGALFFIGKARPWLEDWCRQGGIRLVEFREMDDFAILNSIPSAEGAIQMAMERLPITIHGCQAFVLGLGRTGLTLARTLAALGARVTVVARKQADLARAYEMGCRPVEFHHLGEFVGEAEVVFNTVPALVLQEPVLSRARKGAVIIDLASAPGGTDFEAAHRLGLDAVLAPGLPGKVAPRTAGKIIADLVSRWIEEELPLGR